MDLNQLSLAMSSYSVKRYHVMPTIREQTVGDHSARVALLVRYLTDGKASKELICAALDHDALERITGDIPATAKWDVEFGKAVQAFEQRCNMEYEFGKVKLSEEEQLILKVADMLELCTWASAEVVMGNQFMKECFHNGSQWLITLKLPPHLQSKVDELLGPRKAK